MSEGVAVVYAVSVPPSPTCAHRFVRLAGVLTTRAGTIDNALEGPRMVCCRCGETMPFLVQIGDKLYRAGVLVEPTAAE